MRRLRIGSLSVALAALVVCSLAEAKPPVAHDTLTGFRLSGRFGLFRDGNEVRRARLYHAQAAGAYMLVGVGKPHALLLRTRDASRALEAVPLEDLIPREDGTRDLKRSARIKSIGKFYTKGREIILEGKDFKGALRSKPHLLGWKTARDLLQHKPEYGYSAVSFKANPEKVKALKARKSKIVVKLFFGSWCTECDKQIPRIIHLDQALKRHKNIEFRYYGLPKDTFKQDPEVVKTKVTKLPSGVVYVDGKEANRIVQTDWRNPAWALDSVVATFEMQARN